MKAQGLPFDQPEQAPRFDGATYSPGRDKIRLGDQALRVFELMRDGRWRSLSEIAAGTDCPEASVSARLRDFRKPRFGSHEVERRHLGAGLFTYRVIVNPQCRFL